MINLSEKPSLEFRRRNESSTYRYHPCDPINGFPAWKRENADLHVIQLEGFGWVCVDNQNQIHAIPWGVPTTLMNERPPAGEWVSKKGDISYVYDLVYL